MSMDLNNSAELCPPVLGPCTIEILRSVGVTDAVVVQTMWPAVSFTMNSTAYIVCRSDHGSLSIVGDGLCYVFAGAVDNEYGDRFAACEVVVSVGDAYNSRALETAAITIGTAQDYACQMSYECVSDLLAELS